MIKKISYFKRIKDGIVWRFSVCRWALDVKKHKNIFVFGAPHHSNLGDQAQRYCIEQWIKKEYPEYKLRVCDVQSLTDYNFMYIRLIRKFINDSDKIFIHSGYHVTDIYILEEQMQRFTIQTFPEREIIFFPQTINFLDPKEEQKSKSIYNAHPKITLMCRDNISYEKAQHLFPNNRLLLFPDVVTSMIGKRQYDAPRSGILLCLRNDRESFYSAERKKELAEELSAIDTVSTIDTTISLSAKEIAQDRERIIESTWSDYAKYRCIITDRYHGTIFALVANTPVIVIDSTDHKLSSGVKWFPESFRDYVYYVHDISQIEQVVQKIYSTDYDYKLPPYFYDEYYAKLKQLLEGNNYGNM